MGQTENIVLDVNKFIFININLFVYRASSATEVKRATPDMGCQIRSSEQHCVDAKY